MTRPTYMNIDLDALKHNLTRVNKMAPGCKVIAMVKANAYGHGIVRVAKALAHADALGVASLEEGLILRDAGVPNPIVLMEGIFYPEELLEVMRHNFTLVVHHLPHLEMLENAACDKPLSVWLKIDTGMHRLGIDPTQFSSVYERLLRISFIKKPIGFLTHFAKADALDNESTLKQTEQFVTVTSGLEGPRSLANSAGIIGWPSAHADWVRPGLMLFGASPFAQQTGIDHDLKPVMTLSSRVIAIKQVKKGEQVGYGGEWTAEKDSLIGVVGVGYGDGYPQFAQNGAPVLVNGVICPLAGRVSMDMLTVDLENQPNAKINDAVILWGNGLPVEKLAKYCHTSAYEILTRMTPRPKIQIHSSLSNEQNTVVKVTN